MLPQSVEHGHQRIALLSSFALHDLVSFTLINVPQIGGLRRMGQVSINLERKFYLDCSSDTHCARVEFGRGRSGRRP